MSHKAEALGPLQKESAALRFQAWMLGPACLPLEPDPYSPYPASIEIQTLIIIIIIIPLLTM